MPSLAPGRVVWANLPDPQGNNPKSRRHIVVCNAQVIAAGGLVQVVMVTTKQHGQPDDYVDLQYGDNCLTTFTEPCAALCTHEYSVSPGLLTISKGFIRPDYLNPIIQKMQSLGSKLTKSTHV